MPIPDLSFRNLPERGRAKICGPRLGTDRAKFGPFHGLISNEPRKRSRSGHGYFKRLFRDFAMHLTPRKGWARADSGPRYLRSSQGSKPVMCAPLALIHAHLTKGHRLQKKAHRVKHQAVQDGSTCRAGVPRRILRRGLDSGCDENRVYTFYTRRRLQGVHAFPGRIADCRGQTGVVAKVVPSTAWFADTLTPLGPLQLRLETATAPGMYPVQA